MVISSIHPRYCRQPRHYLSSIHPPCCLQPRHYLSQPPHNQPPKQPDPLWIIKQKCFVLQRIKTEEKAMVVASVWGEEFIQFLASLAILPRTICKNRLNSTFSFKSSWCNSPYYSNRPIGKTASAARNLINSSLLPNRIDDLCLNFCLYPSSMPSSCSVLIERISLLCKLKGNIGAISVLQIRN